MQSPSFLTSISDLRAIAIVMIVLGHATSPSAVDRDGFFPGLLLNLVLGGSTYFVFVSGFMYHYIFYQRRSYRAFLKAKLRTVAMPFIILSVPLVLHLLLRRPEEALELAGPPTLGPPFDQLELGLELLLRGQATPPFWYIPFILAMFALAPLHDRFIRCSFKHQFILAGVMLLISLFVHRSTTGYHLVQQIIYFTPAYLIGIMAAQHQKKLREWRPQKAIILIAAALSIAVLSTALGKVGNYSKPMFDYGGVDLMLIQRLLLCLGLFTLLEAKPLPRFKALGLISATSFTIYFLHVPLFRLMRRADVASLSDLPWVNALWFTGASIIISMACALLARRVLGPRSRMVVGY